MSKIRPISRSFIEWQQASRSLLTLQTALSRGMRAVPATEAPVDPALEALVARQRGIADSLYRLAFAESREHGESDRHPAPAQVGRRSGCRGNA